MHTRVVASTRLDDIGRSGDNVKRHSNIGPDVMHQRHRPRPKTALDARFIIDDSKDNPRSCDAARIGQTDSMIFEELS